MNAKISAFLSFFLKISKNWLRRPRNGRGTPRKSSKTFLGVARVPGSPVHFKFWLCDCYRVIWSRKLKMYPFFWRRISNLVRTQIWANFRFSTSTLTVSRILQKHRRSNFIKWEGLPGPGGVQRTSNEDHTTLRFKNQSQYIDVQKLSKITIFRRWGS